MDKFDYCPYRINNKCNHYGGKCNVPLCLIGKQAIMNLEKLIKPGDFVVVRLSIKSNKIYLCISDKIFASKEFGWTSNVCDIIKILRPKIGFNINSYFEYIERNNYKEISSVFDIIYQTSETKEMTISEIENKLNLTPGSLRIKD